MKGTWTNTKKVNNKIGIIAGSSEHNENEVINVHRDADYMYDYENSDLFKVRLERRGAELDQQRHLSFELKNVDQLNQLSPTNKPDSNGRLRERSLHSLHLKKPVKKNVSPKNRRKKKSLDTSGTPELHRYFKRMKEKKSHIKNASKEKEKESAISGSDKETTGLVSNLKKKFEERK